MCFLADSRKREQFQSGYAKIDYIEPKSHVKITATFAKNLPDCDHTKLLDSIPNRNDEIKLRYIRNWTT